VKCRRDLETTRAGCRMVCLNVFEGTSTSTSTSKEYREDSGNIGKRFADKRHGLRPGKSSEGEPNNEGNSRSESFVIQKSVFVFGCFVSHLQ
jgi:hypothetical protein